jgi:hypothetical protein
MSANAALAEAVARLEYKLDLVLHALRSSGSLSMCMPMDLPGHSCPACLQPVAYDVDLGSCVVVRRCECKTGKLPPTLPIFPVEPSEKDKDNERRDSDDEPRDRKRRKDS